MMANLLNSDVMLGLMSANSSSSLQQVSTKEYYKAKNSGNEGAMASSMGYATNFRDKAMTAVEESREALAENVKAASEEEKAEAAARLEKSRTENTAKINIGDAEKVEGNPQQTAIPQSQPAAILELSDDYIEYAQNASTVEQGTETVKSDIPTVNMHKPNPATNGTNRP